MIQFVWPVFLWIGAVLAPALALFLWWSWRRKQAAIGMFVRSRLLAALTVGVARGRQVLKRVLAGIAFVFLLLALARPASGLEEGEARSMGLDIVVAIDTSKSMLATDIRPNRLERAKLAAQDLMKLAANDRLGLVAFAGSAFLQCPLTLDDEAFRTTLAQMDTEIITDGGSDLAQAIQTATLAFSKEGGNHRVLVLLTDGEDHETEAVTAAKRAAEQGVKIFTLGMGTPNGELLFRNDPYGNKVFIKDANGNAVKSRLNEDLLKEVAQVGDGFYLPFQNSQTVTTLYERGLAPLPKTEGASRTFRQLREQFAWPLGAAVFLLILEIFIPEFRKVKSNGEISMAENSGLKRSAGVNGILVLAAWMGAGPWAMTSGRASAATALRAYERGEYVEAMKEYDRLAERAPGDGRLSLNAGAAAYRAKRYAESAKRFEQATVSEDLGLQQRAYYNLGNAHYRMGEAAEDANEKLTQWKEAVKRYESALGLDAQDEDARRNRDWVQGQVDALEKQMQQQKQQGNDSKNDPNQKDSDKKDSQKDSKDSEGQQDQNQNSEDSNQNSEKSKSSADDKKGEKQKKSDGAGNESQSEQERDASKKPESGEEKEAQRRREQGQEAGGNEADASGKDGADREKPGKDSKSKTQGKKSEGDKAEGAAGSGAESKEAEEQRELEAVREGRMTAQMAEKLLEGQKKNEKAMLFRLMEPKSKGRRAGATKDW